MQAVCWLMNKKLIEDPDFSPKVQSLAKESTGTRTHINLIATGNIFFLCLQVPVEKDKRDLYCSTR